MPMPLRRRPAAVAGFVVAACLGLAACTSQTPAIDLVGPALKASMAEQQLPVARVQITETTASVSYSDGDTLSVWSLVPTVEKGAETTWQPFPVADLDVDDFVSQTRGLIANCKQQYRVTHDAGPAVWLTTFACEGSTTRALIGAHELQPIADAFSTDNLRVLWSDFDEVTLGAAVKNIQLTRQEAVLSLLPTGSACDVVFHRSIAERGDSSFGCQDWPTPPIPLGYSNLSPDAVAAAIQQGRTQTGSQTDTDITVVLEGSSAGPTATVISTNGHRAVIPIK